MKIDEAINRHKNKFENAQKIEEQKRKHRPLSVSNFRAEFRSAYGKYVGRFVEPNKETLAKVSGLIKKLRKNGMETGQDAYEFIEWLFENWPKFKEIKTNNNKNYTLNIRPNLLDIIVCQDYFLAEYFNQEELECKDDENVDLLEMWYNS